MRQSRRFIWDKDKIRDQKIPKREENKVEWKNQQNTIKEIGHIFQIKRLYLTNDTPLKKVYVVDVLNRIGE